MGRRWRRREHPKGTSNWACTHPTQGKPFGDTWPWVTSHPIAMLLPNVFHKSQCLRNNQLYISDIPVLKKKPFEIQRYLCDFIKTFHVPAKKKNEKKRKKWEREHGELHNISETTRKKDGKPQLPVANVRIQGNLLRGHVTFGQLR